MILYKVNNRDYTISFFKAVRLAKTILKNRSNNTCGNKFTITQGKKGGYCVKSNDNWEKFGNANLTQVIITKHEVI